MNASHTPGPWKVEGLAIIGPPEANGDQPHAVDATCVAIVVSRETGSYRHYPKLSAEANAKLIAAAPALLAALKLCENVIGFARLQGDLPESASVNEAMNAARKALDSTL